MAESSIPTVIARSDFVAIVDAKVCAGCGDCVARCQFGALAVVEEVCLVDAGRCVGCGLCTTVCPAEALHLQRRAEGEVPLPPMTSKEWSAQRALARGLTEVP